MEEYFKDPFSAAIIAALIVSAWIHYTQRDGNKELPVKAYTKPAAQVAVLVFFIVHMGQNKREKIMTEPF